MSTLVPFPLLPDYLNACGLTDGDAANDGPSADVSEWTDVNLIVATTVARVSARMRPAFVNVALDLDGGDPMVAGDATALSFALAGTLGALVRAAEDAGDEQDLRVRVTAYEHQVCVAIVGGEVPPLSVLRALTGVPQLDPTMCDPTVAHCRRLIEAEGGSLVITECDGELALALRLPVAPAGKGSRVPAPLRRKRSHAARPALALVA
ncbi:MAG TPA: hypothetical protein VG755_06910 [Nannocystaceae bacterium]|nr:hypothetical protein [Nannocystaceae bacterium]